ncbi:MAG: FAD:protein FMN transferase [Candidatus Paceibacterota bacterium]|jgi:thiamine biosynthesis lipoprotein
MRLYWKKLNAMGTEVVLTAWLSDDQQNALDDAEREIKDFEKRFSRFLEDSELTDFNNAPGGDIAVSDFMKKLLTATQRFFWATDGVFDPTIIGSLEEVGYRKSFTEMTPESEAGVMVNVAQIQNTFAHRTLLTQLQVGKTTVSKPDGLRLDFGGIGKGYILDYVGSHALGEVNDFWISAGGDLYVSGKNGDDGDWHVGVQNPYRPETQLFSLNTRGRMLGIATSGIFKRKGNAGGYEWHHIIDPRTGLPVVNDVLAVTAITRTATEADIYAKTILVLGSQEGLKFIEEQPEAACLIFFKNGSVIFSKRALDYF